MHFDKRTPICSIVVPAYNEASVIKNTLESVSNGTQPNEFDIIVICNGCKDNTAKVARETAPHARVFELTKASKTNALNKGIQLATAYPVIFLDADIQTTAQAIRNLVHHLNWSGKALGYGAAQFNTGDSNYLVRSFYQAWLQNPYFDKHKMGGFFAISKTGIDQLGEIPEVTNDDEYVRRKLLSDSVWVKTAPYLIEAPRNLKNLVQVRSRVYRGNKGLKNGNIKLKKNSNARVFLMRLLKSPSLWPGACVFFSVAIIAHLRNRFCTQQPTWEQDKSARQASTQNS